MLPKSNRLLSREVPDVMRRGRRYQINHLSCMVLPTKDLLPVRFAIIVSTKIDKRATARNRIRRLVREAVQQLAPTIKNGLLVAIVVKKALPNNQNEVRNFVQALVQKAGILSGNTDSV